jgi:hypothetical protein
MERATLQEELIGDIMGLKAALQALMSRVAFDTGRGNEYLEEMRTFATELVQINKVIAPGIRSDVIQRRSEFTINQLVDPTRIRYEDPPSHDGGN